MEFWEQVLKIQPSFGMALGNRGAGRIHYGNILYDMGHRDRFLACAREDLEAALKIELHPNACNRYVQLLEQLSHENRTSIQTENSTKVEETLVSKEIEAYKKWCLNKRLFLNPMNDLSHAESAAQDIVTAPSIIYALDKGPIYHGFFNQLKQEFVGARFLLYEGVIATEPHFSDRDVLLYNTLDYPVYSLHSEKVRIVFRVAYSLLDKIAYFLNSYLSLGIPERQVNIRTMWYVNREKKKGLRKEFNARANWPLRGLFWLTKDLFEDKEGFREVAEPDSQQLESYLPTAIS
jgi:hypothetical protein